MKKAIPILEYVLFTLVILLPVGLVLTACFGYRLELRNDCIGAVAAAVLSVCGTALGGLSKAVTRHKLLRGMFLPVSLFDAVYCLNHCFKGWVIAVILVCTGCSCFLTIQYGKMTSQKMAGLLLSALIGFFGLMALLFGNFGQSTVVQSLESPGGAYYAEVIDDDQGALGGATLVYVYENKQMDLMIARIFPKPREVYWGRWGEYKHMKIWWKDDTHLVINSVEYEME